MKSASFKMSVTCQSIVVSDGSSCWSHFITNNSAPVSTRLSLCASNLKSADESSSCHFYSWGYLEEKKKKLFIWTAPSHNLANVVDPSGSRGGWESRQLSLGPREPGNRLISVGEMSQASSVTRCGPEARNRCWCDPVSFIINKNWGAQTPWLNLVNLIPPPLCVSESELSTLMLLWSWRRITVSSA